MKRLYMIVRDIGVLRLCGSGAASGGNEAEVLENLTIVCPGG